MASSQWITDVDEATFQEAVVEQSMQVPVVVDFWAEWCGPCRQFSPILEKLILEHKGAILLAKIDIDANQNVAGHFGIEAIPAIRIIKDGKLIGGHDGILPEKQLRELFSKLAELGPKGNPVLEKARELEETKPAEAEPLYRKLLEKEPTNEEYRVGLARVHVALNKDEEVLTLLEPIADDGPQGAEVRRIRSVLSLRSLSANVGTDETTLRKQIADNPKIAQPRYELGCLLAQKGKHEDALEMLLSAGDRDMKLAATTVREAMVQIFFALGPSHPLSNSYRSKLALLLS